MTIASHTVTWCALWRWAVWLAACEENRMGGEEKPKCPTCGSDEVPIRVIEAMGEAKKMSRSTLEALLLLLENLYMYGTGNQPEPFQEGVLAAIGRLSPKTRGAVDELGPDAVYTFFRAEFGDGW